MMSKTAVILTWKLQAQAFSGHVQEEKLEKQENENYINPSFSSVLFSTL